MRLQATLVLLAVVITPQVDCDIIWTTPVGGDGDCGSVNENIPLGNLGAATDVEAATDQAGQEHYGPVNSVTPAWIGLDIHGQGSFELVSGTMDYENTTTMVVVFEVNDNLPSTATGTCTIVVNDLNDNTPTFETGVTATVANDAAAGTVVTTTFTATDADGTAPNNDIVSYAITDGAHGELEVEVTTGVISVAPGQTTDCATRPSYTLTVTARDGGSPALTGTGTLQVTVTGEACSSETTTPEPETTTNKSTTPLIDVMLVLLMTLVAGVRRHIL